MNMVVAVDENWGIGRNGGLLAKIPDDMAFFKQKTMGKAVIMGHGTFKSLPFCKPLQGRTNMILSKDEKLAIEGADVYHSIPELLRAAGGYSSEDVFVIGGQSVYEQLLEYCSTAFVTKYFPSRGEADRFFPNLDRLPAWEWIDCIGSGTFEDLSFTFNLYRNSNAVSDGRCT